MEQPDTLQEIQVHHTTTQHTASGAHSIVSQVEPSIDQYNNEVFSKKRGGKKMMVSIYQKVK